jgi:hypothetical protein
MTGLASLEEHPKKRRKEALDLILQCSQDLHQKGEFKTEDLTAEEEVKTDERTGDKRKEGIRGEEDKDRR